MNKKERVELDLFIWAELLNIASKTEEIPSVLAIVKRFKISNRLAYAYHFALRSRSYVSSDEDLSRKLGKALNQVRDLKKTNVKLETENEILEAKINFLQAINIIDNNPSLLKPIRVSTAGRGVDENTVIALLSDVHTEEHVDPFVVNGINEYNPYISARRMELYFRRLLWLVDSLRQGGWKIKNLLLGILGDLINGYIHEEFIEDNFTSPTEAVLFIQDLLVNGIKFLNAHGKFDTITIVCKFGNHGRYSRRKKYSTGYKNSYEWMMYTQLQKYFKELPGFENVEFVVEKGEFTAVQVYNKTLCFSHGDHFNYQGGIGGMLIPFNRWLAKQQKIVKADRYYIAHWHQLMSTKTGVVNGSVIGYTPFAIGHSFEPEVPQQHLGLLDSKRGFTVEIPIILEDW